MKKMGVLWATSLGLIAGFSGVMAISTQIPSMQIQVNADSTEKTVLVGGNIYAGLSASEEQLLAPNFSRMLPESQQDSATWQDLFDNYKEDKGLTVYDVVSIYLDYINGLKTAEEQTDYLLKYKMVTDIDEFKRFAEESFTSFKGYTIDKAATEKNAQQTVSSSPLDDQGKHKFVIVFVPNDVKFTIHYAYADGTKAADDRVITGYLGQAAETIDSPKITGYTPDQTSVPVKFDKNTGEVTVKYTKASEKPVTPTPSTPSTGTGSTTPVTPVSKATLTANPSATINQGDALDSNTFNAKATDATGNIIPVTVNAAQSDLNKPGSYQITLTAANGLSKTVTLTILPKVTQPTNIPKDNSTGLPNWAAVKGQSVYGIKGFYLYKNVNFSKGQRIKYYAKTSRVNRPQFIVKGYKYAANGNLRYQVQQYNPYKGQYVKGTKGYITASQKYVVKSYYATTPKDKQIKVINKNGIKSYQNIKLTGKAKLYKKGSTLKVKSIKKYKLATRYQLTNGQYITGNKKFIIWK